jgi:ABC-type glycerol-3-phosphate transport system substrate-binding protein
MTLLETFAMPPTTVAMEGSSMKNTRRFTGAIALGATLALVVACTAPEGGEEQSPAAGDGGGTGAPSIEGVTIRMLSPGGAVGRVLTHAIEEFQAETGARVEYAELGTTEAIEQQILGLSSGSDDFDIVLVESGYTNAMIGGLEPLNERMAAEDVDPEAYIPATLDLFTQDDTVYAMPFRVGGRVFMYNKTLLAEAGYDAPPETAEEYLEVARAITEAGIADGNVGTLQQGNFLVTQWTPWLRSFGGEVLTEDLQCAAFNDENGVDATQFLVDLYRDATNPEAISWENDRLITEMQAGNAAMAVGFSGWFGEVIDPEVSQVVDDMAVAPNLPHGPNAEHGVTDLGGWGLGVNAASDDERREAAWQFAKFATTPENQLVWALEDGNAPTVSSVFESDEYRQLVPDADNMMNTFATGVRQRPPVDNYTEIEQVLARVLSQALIGDVTPEEALAAAEEEVNGMLGGDCG